MTDAPSPASSNPPPNPPVRRSGRGLWAVLLVVLGGSVVGAAIVFLIVARGHVGGRSSAPGTPAKSADEARKIHAILFYVSDDGTELVQASREVPYGDSPTEQARLLEEAELAPPPSGVVSPIPSGTTLRSIFLAPHGEAYVDLSHDVVTGHTGGSLDETLTVYAIVDALSVNMPDISAVQILIEGHAVDSLAGHLDLRHPLARSFRWVQKGQ